ncbi:hypothetical protein JMJ56_18530 [Belnapia sp. T18]|uniref:EscE/YscE/SsaE family type III secretion system needle protein co-chaperone n=1 Tax=Belnapia arida TaxID=2804533 RepID=A0ABS1U9S0_9PROT|nr:EscE/YscE/SsaE family type III secretion system needle protein co-chaperone [Belnapia arida]MBL6080021.1 hypothetical protein [Belnapia arida]
MSAETDLTELQGRLRGDADGAERRHAEQVLAKLRENVQRQLAAGAAPAEYRELLAVSEAVEAAGQVLQTAWQHYGESKAAR